MRLRYVCRISSRHFIKLKTPLERVYKYFRNVPPKYVSQCSYFKHFHSVGNQSHCEKTIEGSSNGFDVNHGLETMGESRYIRNILYPDSDDPVIKSLNSATCIQDVFDVLKEYESVFNECHVSQSVLVLWDLQRFFNEFSSLQLNLSSEYLGVEPAVENYLKEVSSHPDFQRLLHLLDMWSENFSFDAASCMLMYLNKMNVSLHHPVMQKLISKFNILVDSDVEVSLTGLSRFTIAVHSERNLWSALILKDFIPIILRKLETCDNSDDYHYTTLCLFGTCDLLTDTTIDLYKKHTERLLSDGILTSDSYFAIIKSAAFFNLSMWSGSNVDIIKRLLCLLKGKVKDLPVRDLITLHKIFLSVMEPADILVEIQDRASQLLSEKSELGVPISSLISYPNTCELLSCIVCFNSPLKRQLFEKLTRQHLQKDAPLKSLPSLFRVLRDLKTADVGLCDKYWSLSLEIMDTGTPHYYEYTVFQLCYRYMYFNNNLSGTYRHLEFEKTMIQKLWNIFECGNGSIIPWKFARIAAFIIGYGGYHVPGNESMLNVIMEKVPHLVMQFKTYDCQVVSRGLELAMELKHSKKKMTPQFMGHLVVLNNLLNDAALVQLKNTSLPYSELMNIIRAYLARGGDLNSKLFGQFVDRLKNFNYTLCSSSIRDICAFQFSTKCLIPETIDRLSEYVIENKDLLLGETALKVLHLCFVLGYSPARDAEFFEVSKALILRDKDKMQGLSLLHAALSLCFFHQLPESLIHFIFTVNFLEQLDNEIAHCYAKDTYPSKLRHSLMKLNRSVCLDYPEVGIPWFHQKYIQDTVATKPPQTCPFYMDVYRSLASVLGGEDLIKCNIYSPYGYKLDFQILLNNKRTPAGVKQKSDKDVSRVAVLLLKNNQYTRNVPQLLGEMQLKWKHLEMLGFRVLGIKESTWNSMFMSEPRAKQDFIEKELWPE